MKSIRISTLFIFLAAFSIAVFGQETGGIKGKVRTTGGDGISGVTIVARQNGEDIKSVSSDGGGKFVLDNLKSGIYNVVFTKNGYSSGLKYDVEIKKGKVNDLGDRLIMTVDKGTQVIINGSVFGENGRSLAGVEVKIERIGSDGTIKKIGSLYTNYSGEFAFRQPEGAAKFRITASAKGATASKEVEVGSAAIYRLALTLKSAN